MSTRVYRTDIGTLRPVERRPDGTIRVDAYLSKCGVFQYVQPDGSIRRELRLPEDVFAPEALQSFEGVPVCNNHPPGMIDAKNWRQYAIGATAGVPTADGDHMRGRLSILDASAVAAMDAGKIQVSNGYVCTTLEEPGVHELYGPYDAIQKDIRGNHVALVDRARAGITASARMDSARADGLMIPEGEEATFGISLASSTQSCDSYAMTVPATARLEVVVKHDAEPSASVTVDPNDLATRNAAGKTSAKPHPKDQPGKYADKGGDRAKPVDPDDADDEGDLDDEDEQTDSMYDESGDLTDFGQRKIAAASFAVPGKQKLPIHDPKAVKDSMRKFATHEFDDADEKHAAFNRIAGKAKQFQMNTAGFESRHASKLDRADGAKKDNQMTPQDIKDLQDKAQKRKDKLVAAKARVDALEQELAAAHGEIANLKKDAEVTKKTEPRVDAIDAKFQERVDAKVDLLDKARTTGAKVDSKMSDIEIKRAVVKHVDSDEIPAEKPEPYVDALFEGALKRAKKDADATTRGANALAATRQTIGGAAVHADAEDDTDEVAAMARLRSTSNMQWSARKESK